MARSPVVQPGGSTLIRLCFSAGFQPGCPRKSTDSCNNKLLTTGFIFTIMFNSKLEKNNYYFTKGVFHWHITNQLSSVIVRVLKTGSVTVRRGHA
jgi:hypothetical protein